MIILTLAAITLTSAFPFEALADKRAHGVHQHGVMNIDLAIDGKDARLELEVDTESLFGFEREARSVQEKAKVAEIQKSFRDEISKYLRFEPSDCELKTEKVELKRDGGHQKLQASYRVGCKEEVKGKSLVIDFGIQHPSIKDVRVKVLSEAGAIEKQVGSKDARVSLGGK